MDDWFGIVRWCNDDLVVAMGEDGIEVTQDNIDALRIACENDHHFTDRMIEAGWDTIHYMIHEVFRNEI